MTHPLGGRSPTELRWLLGKGVLTLDCQPRVLPEFLWVPLLAPIQGHGL